MTYRQYCGTPRRRELVRDHVGPPVVNGIDFVEVVDSELAETDPLRQRLIDVTFIRPDGVVDTTGASVLTPDNFRITGGSRVHDIDVVGVDVLGSGDRTLRLTVDRVGDHSIYQLSLHAGANADVPPAGMDWALSRVGFSFKADCPADFDCKPPASPPAVPAPEPVLNYLAKDYESFRQLMLDRMAETVPAWTDRSPADLGVTIVEALAYAADRASYYQDAVATEAFLPLARLRTSVLRHARLLGYESTEGANARTVIAIETTSDKDQPDLLPKGTRFLTRGAQATGQLPVEITPSAEIVDGAINDGAVVFETMEELTRLRVARNRMLLHAWGDKDCCLTIGATAAHVVGTKNDFDLKEGDLLVLEETIPPGGSKDDPPDPAHRQLVRLTETPIDRRDDVLGVDVVELVWGEDDALTFPLNLGSDGGVPGAVARGNVVLADHGRTVDHATPRAEDEIVAEGSGLIDDDAPGARLRPRLDARRIVYARPFDGMKERRRSATSALDPTEPSLAEVELTGEGETWSPQLDLLASDRFSPDFKVEPLDGGGARILFADPAEGRAPTSIRGFTASIRHGGGPAGNIGADAIRHVVTHEVGLFESVRNPLPGIGGTDPETPVAIKIAAPRAFRRQKRAVTPADYAAAAETFRTVQRATADWRWTGSWYTVFLTIDREGGRRVDEEFEADLRRHLAAQRLAGHDLEILRPDFVELNIELIVCVDPNHYAADVERGLLDRFTSGYTRAGLKGFFHPDNFSFGQPVRYSAVVAAAMEVTGVTWVGVRLDATTRPGIFGRLDQPKIDYSDDGEIAVGAKEVARLDNDPNAPENGHLEFRMKGGR